MISPSANFTTENDKLGKQPCFILIFDETADPKFCSADFADRTSVYKKYISSITVESPELDFDEQFLKLSKLTFTLIDKDNEVTTLLKDEKIINQKVSVKFGYQALDEADFISFPDFYIKDYSISNDLLTYTFTCDESSSLIDKIYNYDILRVIPESELDSDLTSSATNIVVVSSDSFDVNMAGTVSIFPALIIDNELITYTGVNDTTETFSGATRGFSLSSAAKHSEGTKVTECYYFKYFDLTGQYNLQSTFSQFALILLSSKSGGGSGDTYDFGLGKNNFGLGLTEDQIDVEQIEAEGYRYHMPNFTATDSTKYEKYEIFLNKKENGKSFLERIAKPFNAWWYIDNNKLKLKVLNLPDLVCDYVTTSGHDVLNDDRCKIVGIKTMKEQLKNEFDLYHDHLITTGNYDTLSNHDITESQAAYGSFPIETIYADGFQSGTDSVATHMIDRRGIFFGNLLWKLKINTLEKYCLYEPFDMIKLTSSYLPNTSSGNRTTTNAPVMIMKQTLRQSLDDFNVEYDAVSFESVNKANTMYSTHQITTGFDDDDIDYNADFSTTLDAEDGYHDYSYTETDYVYVKVDIVWPNDAGADEQQMIKIGLMALSLSPTTEICRNAIKVRYHTTWNKTSSYWFPLLVLGDDVQRIQINWHYRSTATGTKLPSSITLKEIRYVKVTY